ncbi:MAG: cyclic nucleotide-binding domain-containing protein [Synechococcus sp. MED-G67]|nr:MAG: cyclic nucleotide-binding domain-containing protein [Synechococcus sp. MED-G67]HCA61043.1 cyclic nucleotide-binding protein [Synechococcales bacterium UBA8647]
MPAGVSATPEASSWRQRLQLLLESHIDELKAKKLQPPLNSVVIEQGSRATRILIVSQGRLAVEQQLPGQAMRTLAEVGPGDLLGEMALFGGGEHSARVRVVEEPTVLLSIERAAVLDALLFDGDLSAELLHMSSERCRQSNQMIGLLLDGLEACAANDAEALTPILEKLNGSTESMVRAAELLGSLRASIAKPS